MTEADAPAASVEEIFANATLDAIDAVAPRLEGRRVGFEECAFAAPTQRLTDGIVLVQVDCGNGVDGLFATFNARAGGPSPFGCTTNGELTLCGQGFALAEPNTVVEVLAQKGSDAEMRTLAQRTSEALARALGDADAPATDETRGGTPASDGVDACDAFGEALVRTNPTYDGRRIRSATFPNGAEPPVVETFSGRQTLECSRQLIADDGGTAGDVVVGTVEVGPDSLPPQCTSPVELVDSAPAVAERTQTELVQCAPNVAGPVDRSWSVSALGDAATLTAAFTWLDLIEFDGSTLPSAG